MATTTNGTVTTIADLVALLPPTVFAAVDHDTLRERPFAAALRVLVTIRNSGWWDYVRTYTIDWAPMLTWARTEFGPADNVRIRVELAASLDGYEGARASLMYGARVLDERNYSALMDAMRIARQGVSR